MGEVSRDGNVLIRIQSFFLLRIKCRFRTLTSVSKYFDKMSQDNVGVLKKKRDLGGYKKKNKYKKPQITLEDCSHIPGEWCRDGAGKRFSQALSGRKSRRWPCSPVCRGPSPTAALLLYCGTRTPGSLLHTSTCEAVVPEPGLAFSLALMQDYQPELLPLVSRVSLMNPLAISCVGLFILLTPSCTSLPP